MTSAAFYGGGGGTEKSFELCFMLRLSTCDFIHIHRAHKQISRTSFLYLQDTKSEYLFSQASGTGPSLISCDADGSRKEKKQPLSDSQK